jgi:hypothetical protein
MQANYHPNIEKFKKIKPSISRKHRGLPDSIRSMSNSKKSSKKSSKKGSFISPSNAARNKLQNLNKTKRRYSSVKKDIGEQLKIAKTFIAKIISGPMPILTPTHLMGIKYDEFKKIVLIDNQNLYYNSKYTGYATPRDLCLDLAKKMGYWNLFIIVKPKLDSMQPDYYQERKNANIIVFNINCLTLNGGKLQGCHEVHGFNESDDYLLLLLYKYFKNNSLVDVSILSGDNYKHTHKDLSYFYIDEKLKSKKFDIRTYFKQFHRDILSYE